MEKIWLKSYPPGVPSEINPDQYHSLVELFEQSFKKFSANPAFYSLGVTLTYKEIDESSLAFAAYLQQVLKLKKGDRLALMLPNVLQYPIALIGALRAGLIVVNVNPLYTPHELVYQLKDAGVDSIVVLENFAQTVEKSLDQVKFKHVIVARIEEYFSPLKALVARILLKYIRKKIPAYAIPFVLDFKQVIKEGKKLSLSPVSIQNEDLAFLQYTGGTTGLSKGAMLTHRNIIANIEQGYAWLRAKTSLDKQEVVLSALPLYHIFSLVVNFLICSTKLGALNVLITNPRDGAGMVSEMKKFKFTVITGVNTLFNALLKDPRFTSMDFSRLKLTVGGGMAVQHAVADRWQEVTGNVLLEGYGLTEASPCVSMNPFDIKTYNGKIGLPLPSTEVAIMDEEGRELSIDQTGELAVKGPQVMKGYWHHADETQHVFTKDGWLLTGDLASIDAQGYLRIMERKKDMILVSGFNVYPNEIEDVIASMPGVHEVAVVGVMDEASGEAVKAFIVRSDPKLTADDVVQFCRKTLTGYKIPKQVEFRDELPKSNVGKILRRELREKA